VRSESLKQNAADKSNNERQKTILLREAGRLDREQTQVLIEDTKKAAGKTKILCEETKTLLRRAS
jgi:hypothetical protein